MLKTLMQSPVVIFVVGILLSSWMVLLASHGLVVLMLVQLGLFFLLAFLIGMFQPPGYRRLKTYLALPTTLIGIPLAILAGMNLGLRPLLFWVALAILVWLMCFSGTILGARKRLKYASVFAPQSHNE